jgi:hypothetical protein
LSSVVAHYHFETGLEKIVFSNRILSLVPELLLAFGNLTNDANKSIYYGILRRSPVVLIKARSPEIDDLCRMIPHARYELAKQQLIAQVGQCHD